MFSHTFNGLTYSDTSSSSSSSSPNSFAQSPIRPSSAHIPNHHHKVPVPDVPSTFLPSYYPEGRYNSLDRELGLELSGNSTTAHGPGHSPATWELLSQAGPSSRHLLDGTNIVQPSRTNNTRTGGMKPPAPEYRTSPGSIASSFINKAAASPSFPMDPALQSASGSGGGSGSHPHSHSHSAQNTYAGESSGGGGGGGGSGGGGRYHPYSHPGDRSSGMTASSSGGGGGGGGGGSMSRNNTYNNTVPDSSSSSTAYPANLFANMPLPDRPNLDQWERMGMGNGNGTSEITGEDYAKALELYNHMLEAVPNIRSQHDPSNGGQRYDHLLDLASDGLSFLTGTPHPQAQPPYAPNQGQGQGQGHPMQYHPDQSSSIPPPPTISNKRSAPSGSGSGANGDKKAPKCLGCGATETPEWRRGPMGPRTLCNACGLVHMKLQRKKKKQEEKAAAAAAAREGRS